MTDRFEAGLQAHWRVTALGHARVEAESGALFMTTDTTPAGTYSDAQISDYEGANFRWRPPLHMSVTAQAAPEVGQLRGTAGFGFWNQPFMPGHISLRLPQAIWFFFASPPNNMQLAQDVPGSGWKAATIDAHRWQFLAMLPTAPPGVLLMRIPALYRRLWPIAQRAIGVSETLLDPRLLHETHTYTIDWRLDGATFAVDGEIVHEVPISPTGPLGFVAWIDNQYAIVTPQGQFGFGVVPLEHEQTLRLEEVSIEAD